ALTSSDHAEPDVVGALHWYVLQQASPSVLVLCAAAERGCIPLPEIALLLVLDVVAHERRCHDGPDPERGDRSTAADGGLSLRCLLLVVALPGLIDAGHASPRSRKG